MLSLRDLGNHLISLWVLVSSEKLEMARKIGHSY